MYGEQADPAGDASGTAQPRRRGGTRHTDGTITVDGHINQFFVNAGQQVAAAQQIAEVGNRGQPTGPHLHIETHRGGLYQDRVNPAPWLGARGITLGGSCG